MEGRQLTLELFDLLEEAERLPEDMSVLPLLEQLDRTLCDIAGPEQLALAGEALARLAGAFSERAELVLGAWFKGGRDRVALLATLNSPNCLLAKALRI